MISKPNRALLRRRLNRLGVTDILEAEDGAEALNIIRATALDLVLLVHHDAGDDRLRRAGGAGRRGL